MIKKIAPQPQIICSNIRVLVILYRTIHLYLHSKALWYLFEYFKTHSNKSQVVNGHSLPGVKKSH
jgi:hypothetical protein